MKRELNTEILRILIMLFIIMHHMILNGFGLREIEMNNLEQLNIIWSGVNAFLVVSVNVFFIISGYYSIKFSLNKTVNIILVTYFYFIVINILFIILGKQDIGLELLKDIIFPVGSYWFILVYIILSIFSPYINLMLNNCNKVMIERLMICAIFVFSIYGFLVPNPAVGVNKGYSLVFAIFLYIIGYYLRNFFEWNKNKAFFLIVYLLTSGINGLIAMLLINIGKGPIAWTMYSYNNPLVLMGSIALFLYFKDIGISYKKRSSIIISISSTVLAIYLIHSTPILSTYLFSLLKQFTNNTNLFFDIVILLTYSMLIFLISALVELLIRRGIFNKLFDKMSRQLSDKIKKIFLNL
jgi:surface polysaccharide O-acyltransferase-like enzyme